MNIDSVRETAANAALNILKSGQLSSVPTDTRAIIDEACKDSQGIDIDSETTRAVDIAVTRFVVEDSGPVSTIRELPKFDYFTVTNGIADFIEADLDNPISQTLAAHNSYNPNLEVRKRKLYENPDTNWAVGAALNDGFQVTDQDIQEIAISLINSFGERTDTPSAIAVILKKHITPSNEYREALLAKIKSLSSREDHPALTYISGVFRLNEITNQMGDSNLDATRLILRLINCLTESEETETLSKLKATLQNDELFTEIEGIIHTRRKIGLYIAADTATKPRAEIYKRLQQGRP